MYTNRDELLAYEKGFCSVIHLAVIYLFPKNFYSVSKFHLLYALMGDGPIYRCVKRSA
jgi:hypothetical protein